MKFIIIALIFLVLFLLSNKTINESFYEPRIHIIGPSINRLSPTDDSFQTNYAQNIDPYDLNLKNNNIFLTSYQNNNRDTLNDYNIRESIIYASIKEILNETKNKLNNNNPPIYYTVGSLGKNKYNLILSDHNKKFYPIINTIFNSINGIANNAVYVKPTNITQFDALFNPDLSIYIINSVFDIDVNHPLDTIFKNNKIKSVSSKNELPLQLIIKFSIRSQALDQSQETNPNIYINDLSVVIKK